MDTLLGRLTAETRARVAWAKKPIENGLARLRAEPLTDELVVEVVEDTVKPLLSLGRAFREVVGASPDEWRARLMEDFKREENQLAAFVADEDSRDTLHWIVSLLRVFLGLTLSVPPEFIEQLDEAAFAGVTADEDFKPYLRALVVLMAAAEAAKEGRDPGRARDLLDVAFLELIKFRNVLRKHGVSLTPFPYETTDDRRKGLLEAVDRLRRTLSDDDWRVLEKARAGNLR